MLPNEVQNYDFAFTQASIGMALISLDGLLLKANSALCKLLGYTLDDLNTLSPNPPAVHELIHNLIQNGKPLQSKLLDQALLEPSYDHPAGYRSSLGITISVIRDQQDEPLYYFAQFENKSLIRQMENHVQHTKINLHENEDAFQQMLDGLPLAVLITDHGIIQYTNPAGLRLIHADNMDMIIGMSTNNIVDASNHDRISERRKKYYTHNSAGAICYLIRCLNGEQKYVEGYSFSITYNGNRAILGVFKDLSEQMVEDERLMQSERLSTAGQLAAGIAHEIRNPLTAINGFMKLLRSSEHKNEQYFSIIESELKRIEFIVNELLILSKPQTVNINKPLNFSSIIEQVITLMSGQAAMKNIEILPTFPEQSIWILGEPNQLKQVFINLFKNAIEAMDHGGIIHIQICSSDNKARIHVQDEGCGMTEEQIQRLGRPFFTTKESGTGLGFMITQNIIHNHGGVISIVSELEHGTTFTVTIPTIMEPEEAII